MSSSPNNSAVSAPKPGGSPAGGDGERAGSKGSDEDENGLGRKKLRLSKEQSAFLEESFKEHNTLNPVSFYYFFYITKHNWSFF